MSSTGAVSLSPTDLFFPAPFDRKIENVLYLSNSESGASGVPNRTQPDGFMVFKIKSTQPSCYNVKPTTGLLYPESIKTLRIALKPGAADGGGGVVTNSSNSNSIHQHQSALYRDKHCFRLEVRRVQSERQLNKTLEILADANGEERKANQSLKDLYEGSCTAVMGQWTLNCMYGNEGTGNSSGGVNLVWEPQRSPSSVGAGSGSGGADSDERRGKHTGMAVVRSSKGDVIYSSEATVCFPVPGSSVSNRESSMGAYSSAPSAMSPVPSTRNRLEAGDTLRTVSSLGSVGGGDANGAAASSSIESAASIAQTRRLEEEIESKRAEEARLKVELLALQNQTTQLNEECEAVLAASKKNAKKLAEVEAEAIKRRKRYGTIHWISLPVPVMAVFLLVVFILALAMRPPVPVQDSD